MKPIYQSPSTRRIENVRRDTRSPQRLGYPIYHTRTHRRPDKAHPLAFAAAYGGSALITISAIIIAWHYLTTL
jgi:hypothetical protein